MDKIRRIVISGGGTAGWMAAGALARLIPHAGVAITLVESEEIGTVGVGEATIPSIQTYNGMLGIDEAEFLRDTKGTCKLGIEFVNWDAMGDSYIHPFGTHGVDWQGIRFHQFWLRVAKATAAANPPGRWGRFESYSISAAAARLNRFSPPAGGPESVLSSLKYAYHFDAGLYARFLRAYSEQRGVRRVEGRIVEVVQADSGDIAAIRLHNESYIEGDLFIDCTGFRGLLIEGALKTGFEDWSHWLPNNSALAVPSERAAVLTPYTRATAESAGWRWRIPLQHRTGNGHVYSSDFISDEAAAERLLAGLDTKALDTPRPIRFRTGRRKAFWNRNCIALGLAAGFLEPLESTSIHLIQTGVAKLLALFPGPGGWETERDEYNALTAREYEQARDFIILHYKATRRDDSDYWRYLRHMDIPDSLKRKIDLFRVRGRVFRYQDELFTEDSWLAVMFGQGIVPDGYDPVADSVPMRDVEALVNRIGAIIARTAEGLPPHDQAVARFTAAMQTGT